MKKMLYKLLKILGIILIVILVGMVILIFFTGPKLPDKTNIIIKNVMDSDIPDFVKGKSGYVVSNNINIWYESISPIDTNKGAVLLFMGISNDALGWPQTFIDKLVDSGYRVIRYDYRGTGLSDWIENWRDTPYSLRDLANDAKIILDTLNIKKANLVGVSLGGMVAQEFAIEHTDRTLTLTSMMSSGNIIDKELPKISKSIVIDLIKIGFKYGIIPSEKNTIKLNIAARVILRGEAKYNIDVKGTAEQVLYNLKKRKGYNPNASAQHHEATFRSDSRYEKLKRLKIPVLIIHGLNDPFIPIEHSKKLASLIPNSKTKWYDNMGHDLPMNLIDSVTNEIILNFKMKQD